MLHCLRPLPTSLLPNSPIPNPLADEWLVDSYRVFAHAHSTLCSDYQKAVEAAGGVGKQQRGKSSAPGGQFGGAGLEDEEVAAEEQAMQDFLVGD